MHSATVHLRIQHACLSHKHRRHNARGRSQSAPSCIYVRWGTRGTTTNDVFSWNADQHMRTPMPRYAERTSRMSWAELHGLWPPMHTRRNARKTKKN